MFSSNVPFNPRPRPPAKLRHSSSHTRPAYLHLGLRTPPPYAPFASNLVDHHLPTLLGSPITATSQLIRLDEVHRKGENLKEKSKEELEELLRRASEIIRDRERELDLTSETCRALAENNASLKSRNDTLIARLPPSQPSSPLTSPSIHGAPLLSPAHSRSSSRSLLLSPKPLLSAQASMRRNRPGHARRISSTPAELAVLADQNSELIAKLADVEAEATRAEQAGKRRLKNLETEIETLRDELERAREESQQLQETVQSAPHQVALVDLEGLPGDLDKQVVKMFQRLSREAKVRELKAKTRPWEQQVQDEKREEGPKNFAPDNLTPGLPFTSKIVSRKVSAPDLHIDTALDQPMRPRNVTTPNINLPVVDSPVSSVPPSASSTVIPNAREQALVSQLLLKIRELEETNAQLEANHLKASIRLREAQTESESVRRLCEFISDEVEGDLDVELEVVQDDDAEEDTEFANQLQIRNGDRAPRGETEVFNDDDGHSGLRFQSKPKVRLRSVSRKASMDFGGNNESSTRTRRSVRLRKFSSVDSFSFPAPPLESSPLHPPASVRGAARNGNAGVTGRPKTRKTVLGLFNDREERSTVTVTTSGGTGRDNVDDSEAASTLPRTPELSFDQPMPSRKPRRARFPAPSPSVLEPPSSPASVVGLNPGTDTAPITTTDAILILDNETATDTEGPSHMQSLGSELGLELEGFRPPPAMGHHTRTKSIMELLHSHDSHGTDLPSPISSASALPSPTVGLGLRPSSPTNSGRKMSSSSGRGVGAPPALASLDERITYPRLRKAKSSAIFGFGLGVGPSWAHNPEGNAYRNNVSGHSGADTATYNSRNSVRRRRNSLSVLSHSYNDSPSTPCEKEKEKRSPQETPKKNSYERLRALLLEVWLWLYFVAVIVVFVFTVARKGPKGVLNAKASSGSGSGSGSGSKSFVGGRKGAA